jgi:hypothetical protein
MAKTQESKNSKKDWTKLRVKFLISMMIQEAKINILATSHLKVEDYHLQIQPLVLKDVLLLLKV